MKRDVYNEVQLCYWHNTAEQAVAIMEKHISDIDFDDEDDMKSLIDLVGAALDNKDVTLLEFLISKGFDVNYKLLKKDCLLLQCADKCLDPKVFHRLAELGCDVYSERSSGENALLLSAKRQFERYARTDTAEESLPVYLVENYDISRLNKTDAYGATPLLYAVEKDKPRLVEALLAKGVDVNETGTAPMGGYGIWSSYNGVTALSLACREGRTEIAKKLLQAGADETLRNAAGQPPIFYLVQYPFNFLRQNHYNSPLFDKKCEMIAMFKDLDVTDAQGRTVLIDSLCDRNTVYTNSPITLALIAAGADVNATGNDGRRALHFAAEYRQTETVKALVAAGAEVNAQDKTGNSALHFCCAGGDEKTARFLLRKGADGTLRNNGGASPADIAAEKGLNDVLEMLI